MLQVSTRTARPTAGLVVSWATVLKALSRGAAGAPAAFALAAEAKSAAVMVAATIPIAMA
jgi:hypothetical protein